MTAIYLQNDKMKHMVKGSSMSFRVLIIFCHISNRYVNTFITCALKYIVMPTSAQKGNFGLETLNGNVAFIPQHSKWKLLHS